MFIFFAMMDLYQNDELFADYNCERFTLTKQDGFETLSERKVRKFPTYVYNEIL